MIIVIVVTVSRSRLEMIEKVNHNSHTPGETAARHNSTISIPAQHPYCSECTQNNNDNILCYMVEQQTLKNSLAQYTTILPLTLRESWTEIWSVIDQPLQKVLSYPTNLDAAVWGDLVYVTRDYMAPLSLLCSCDADPDISSVNLMSGNFEDNHCFLETLSVVQRDLRQNLFYCLAAQPKKTLRSWTVTCSQKRHNSARKHNFERKYNSEVCCLSVHRLENYD